MPARYKLSFTAGGLLYYESIVVAEALERAEFDWDGAIEKVVSENLLQSRTTSTTTRKLREVKQRLELLNREQLELLISGSRADQKLLIWLACCRRYQLLTEFAREVLRGKFLELDISIQPLDVEKFFESKSLWHEELDELAPSTSIKLQTVLTRMLRESELVSDKGIIQSPLMSKRLVEVLQSDSMENFNYYPMGLPE